MKKQLLFGIFLYAITILCSDAFANCVQNSRTCVEGAATRIISGHPVTRSCWRYVSSFTCDGTVAVEDNYCQELRDRGCSPVSQTCDADSCDQVYDCSSGSTPTVTDCEDQSVAIGGLEYNTGYVANSDLGLAASNMAAVEGTITGMIKDDLSCYENPPGSGSYECTEPIKIFSGEGLACRKDSVGFNKCCKLDGWGTDAGLTACNTEEHKLGYSRLAGRSHYVGKYCHKDSVFGCYAYKYVYCSYGSKIGRMIQEQGKVQLGIGWGSAKQPNCRGLTPEEISSINYDLIDFSEYFGDAFGDMENPPTSGEMETIIESFMDRLEAAGCSQFDPDCDF